MTSIASIVEAIRPLAAGAATTLLLGEGQLSRDPAQPRILVLALREGQAPVTAWDGSSPRADRASLERALSAIAPVWPGALDTMVATPWRHAWTRSPAPFRLFDPRGLRLAIDVDARLLRLSADGREIPLDAIARVRSDLSDDWVERGVSLILRSGEALSIASARAPEAALDPAYDALDLELDAAWIPALGGALARLLGVVYEAADHALA